MKKLLPLISLATLFLITQPGILQAQVLNDNTFNIEVHFVKGQMSFVEETTSSDVTMIGRAVPSGPYTPIFSYAEGALNDPKSCYTYRATGGDPGTGNYWNYGPIVDENMGTLIDNPDQFFKYEIRSWRRQFGNEGCVFQSGDNRAASRIWSVSAQTAYPSFEWYEYPVIEYDDPFLGAAKRRAVIKSTWRYAKGERSAPLDFGLVAANQTLTHSNSNRSAVANANAKLGYKNDWTAADNAAFSDDNDVTYTFSVTDSRTVSITTAFTTTNFDTKVHLIQLNSDGSFANYITGNDQHSITTSTNWYKGAIQNFSICKGDYAIIVEGGNDFADFDTGDFFLVLDVSNLYLLGGTITGGGTVPNPQEFPKEMTSTQDAIAGSTTYVTWEIRPASGNWQYLSGTGAGGEDARQSYTFNGVRNIPANLTEPTYFRRKVDDRCFDHVSGTIPKSAYSNEVYYNVYEANGVLAGRVVDKAGIGVGGITITAERITSIANGVANKTFTTTTGSDGYYTISGVHYGLSTPGSGATADFTITPSQGSHVFALPSIDRTLTQLVPQQSNINFVDETVFSITGKVTQECADCVGATVGNPIVSGVEDVEFLIDGVKDLFNKTTADGTYSLSVDNSGNYVVKPEFKNHQLTPVERTVNITTQVETPNIDFVDVSTHTISGNFTAGCGEYIGQANLRFTQILPNGNNGSFIKEITTNAGSGAYSITLPAAKYQVSVINITDNPANINPLTVVEFINAFPSDSLTRDAVEADKTLDIVYPRPPVLEVVGLDNVCLDPTPFALIEQNKVKVLTIKVWQGEARTGPAKDS
ncbi:MAG: carboxypeptidase-like regulatory domain-containing protein, partial [Spirosomaceae bacterium]|nr:carboxypeptidase-like regulatory domain-containing protein [Spirosomataceae bacterium]